MRTFRKGNGLDRILFYAMVTFHGVWETRKVASVYRGTVLSSVFRR